MKLNSSNMFFLMFVIIGTMMCLSSNNWLFIWCGLELSLISMLPLMVSNLILSSESTIKYFLIQSVSSTILILGLMSMVLMVKFNSNLVIILSIMMKMGVAPFHLWLLSVVEGLSILPMILLFTISKIPPLMMLSFITISVSFIISLTLIVGSTLGLNQSSIRKIISYSSIFNMGLILISIKNNFIWFYYLLIYSILVITLMNFIYKMNMFYINQLILNEELFSDKLILLLILLSMGGLPPFIGFSIKLVVIEFMVSNMIMINLILTIILSMLVMFFYLRLSYLSLMFFSLSSKLTLMKKNFSPLWLMIFNTMMLPMILTLKVFF